MFLCVWEGGKINSKSFKGVKDFSLTFERVMKEFAKPKRNQKVKNRFKSSLKWGNRFFLMTTLQMILTCSLIMFKLGLTRRAGKAADWACLSVAKIFNLCKAKYFNNRFYSYLYSNFVKEVFIHLQPMLSSRRVLIY